MSALNPDDLQVAIGKCLSHSEAERIQAHAYLSECEGSSEFLPLMFKCFVALQHADFNASLQVLIYIKNTIKRMMAARTNRRFFKPNTNVDNTKIEETMGMVRTAVLELAQSSYDPRIEKQTIEIIGAIAWKDFPAKWESLAQYLLRGLESARAQILSENNGKESVESLSPTLRGQLQKFIAIYRVVMKEQMRKKLQPSKAHFYKLARPFIEATYSLVLLFDSGFQRIFSGSVAIALSDQDVSILKIGYSLDKLVLSVAFCGFNPTELATQNEKDLIEVRLIHKYLEKLKCYMDLIQAACKSSAEVSFKLLCKFSKGIFDKLSEMQHTEAVIMFSLLDQYLGGALAFLFMASENFFPEELQRACLLCLHRVLDTSVYSGQNSGALITGKYSGIVASSTKSRNFEEYMSKAKAAFSSFFSATTVVNLFDLIVSRYLPIKSIDSWVNDPEGFIEQEDDNFIHEFESDKESSISYLAYSILEQLLTHFPVVCAKQIKKYVENLTTGKLQSYDIFIQDAIYNAIAMMPKVYSQDLLAELPDLKPEAFLSFLEAQIVSSRTPMHSHVLQRRYTILIAKWLEFVQKENVLGYLKSVVKIMIETDQLVLKFHACIAMKRILDFLSGKSSSQGGNGDANLGASNGTGLKSVERTINYEELLASSAKVIVDVFTRFNSAKIVWTMMNLLTLLIEKCQYRCNENIIQVLQLSNFSALFSFKHELVQEALIEMCKALVMSFPSSIAMLELCIHLIDLRLTVILLLTVIGEDKQYKRVYVLAICAKDGKFWSRGSDFAKEPVHQIRREFADSDEQARDRVGL